MRFSRALVASLAVASAPLGACRNHEPLAAAGAPATPAPAPAPATHAPAPPPDPFVYAQAERVADPMPLRFLGRLPESEDEFDGDWAAFPPRAGVQAALCAGDRSMQARLLAAVRTAAARGVLGTRLSLRYADLLGDCGTDALCGWLAAEAIARPNAPAVREVFWRGLAHCRGPAQAAALEGDAVPDEVLVDLWYERYDVRPTAWSPRLARAAENLVKAGKRRTFRKIGVVVGRFLDPEAVDLVARLQAGVRDRVARAQLAVGLVGHADPRARALFDEACAVTADPFCRLRDPGFPASESLEEAVRGPDAELDALAARAPEGRAGVAAVARRCAADAALPPVDRANCLERLAILDRADATRVARALPATERPPLAQVAAALTRFPEPEAQARRLGDLRLLPAGAAASRDGQLLLTAEELLLAHRRAANFAIDTNQFPSEHEGLASRLASLAGPGLAGVAFDEVPPADDDGPYRLRAWIDGYRYEAAAADLGTAYDVTAVVGLLNTLLRDRRSELRFVALPTGDGTATVAVGPRPGLLAARAEGLLGFAHETSAPVAVPADGGPDGAARDVRLVPAPATGPLAP